MKYIVIHCSATSPTQDIDIHDIRRWHIKGNGWSDVGYHVVITRDGEIQYGRPFDRKGAHVKGHNKDSIGVCLVGGIDSEGNPEANFTGEQQLSLHRVLQAMEILFPNSEVKGHRDFEGVQKACPSFNVEKFLRTGIMEL